MKNDIRSFTDLPEVSPYQHCKYMIFDIACIFNLESQIFSIVWSCVYVCIVCHDYKSCFIVAGHCRFGDYNL
jgi:hypothetical protein